MNKKALLHGYYIRGETEQKRMPQVACRAFGGIL